MLHSLHILEMPPLVPERELITFHLGAWRQCWHCRSNTPETGNVKSWEGTYRGTWRSQYVPMQTAWKKHLSESLKNNNFDNIDDLHFNTARLISLGRKKL